MPKRKLTLALVCLAALAAACSPAPTPPPATPTVPARATTLRFEFNDFPDVADIPRYMAMDALQAQGYTIEKTAFDDDALVFVAMQKDDLDFSTLADVLGWNAIHNGAPAFVAMDETGLTLMVLADDTVQTCADMDGKPVAISNVSGANATLLYHYIDENCPGIHPEYVTISGSSGRMAALLAGEVNATAMTLSGYLDMDKDQAAKYHPLVFYADEFPGLSTISTFMRRGLADEYPESVKDIIRAILQARREIQDPQVLTDQIVKYMALDPAVARERADFFLTHKTWNVNGGYTLQSLQSKIDWYGDSGELPAGLKAEDVADLSYLNAVLDEIGRK